jgi:hypothetical protein
MDWNRVNAWTLTLYALIHSLHQARENNFEPKSELRETVEDAAGWTSTKSSYNSVLLSQPFRRTLLRFRRDPNTHFDLIVNQLIQMLLQDLVVIFDAMMDDILAARSKVEKLATHLDNRFIWAKHGCLELIAARNVLTHAGGRWNSKSIKIVQSFVAPPPRVGDPLVVGVPLVFQYRKAMRTFLNEVKP